MKAQLPTWTYLATLSLWRLSGPLFNSMSLPYQPGPLETPTLREQKQLISSPYFRSIMWGSRRRFHCCCCGRTTKPGWWILTWDKTFHPGQGVSWYIMPPHLNADGCLSHLSPTTNQQAFDAAAGSSPVMLVIACQKSWNWSAPITLSAFIGENSGGLFLTGNMCSTNLLIIILN